MKALTLRQPWAWAVMHGGKDVENRAWVSRPALQPGDVLAVHAGRGVDDVTGDRSWARALVATRGPATHPAGLPSGALLGTVRVVDVHHADDCSTEPGLPGCSPWAQPDVWHVQITEPRPLPEPLLDVRGALGLWNVDPMHAFALAVHRPEGA